MTQPTPECSLNEFAETKVESKAKAEAEQNVISLDAGFVVECKCVHHVRHSLLQKQKHVGTVQPLATTMKGKEPQCVHHVRHSSLTKTFHAGSVQPLATTMKGREPQCVHHVSEAQLTDENISCRQSTATRHNIEGKGATFVPTLASNL